MEREELRNKFTEVLTIDDQAQRSTVLNEMRSEIETIYGELDHLHELNKTLEEKNTALTEANSKLFMQIGTEKSHDGKPQVKETIDLKKLGI